MSRERGGITCPYCGHVNRVGTLFCEECGELLEGAEHASDGSQQAADVVPIPVPGEDEDTLRVHSTGTADSNNYGSTSFHNAMMLYLFIEGPDETIALRPMEGQELSIGRSDKQSDHVPDIDLAPYGGYRLGISRRHAVLRLEAQQLLIRDVGSSNGTMVNGVRLPKDAVRVLRHGDRLRLGNLNVDVEFKAEL